MSVPWTARSSDQSILKDISPRCSLEGMMLKLKFQYFGHLMWRVTNWKILWCWEILGAGREGDDRGWDGWMASLTRWTWVWVNSRSWWWTERPGVLRFMGLQRVGHDWSNLAAAAAAAAAHWHWASGAHSDSLFINALNSSFFFPDNISWDHLPNKSSYAQILVSGVNLKSWSLCQYLFFFSILILNTEGSNATHW